jgi:phosphoribosylamine-glycine ligase
LVLQSDIVFSQEAPVANFVVDALEAVGIKAIGPTKLMAKV